MLEKHKQDISGIQRNERLNLVWNKNQKNHRAFYGINVIHDELCRFIKFLKECGEVAPTTGLSGQRNCNNLFTNCSCKILL